MSGDLEKEDSSKECPESPTGCHDWKYLSQYEAGRFPEDIYTSIELHNLYKCTYCEETKSEYAGSHRLYNIDN